MTGNLTLFKSSDTADFPYLEFTDYTGSKNKRIDYGTGSGSILLPNTSGTLATQEWVNSARINTSGTFTCTFKNSSYGTNFNGGYRLNLMDRTINVTAGFGFNVANFPSSNSFNIIATGFPKPKFDTKVPIYYMRSSNYGAVAILYQDGSLGINRSGVSSPSNDYVFVEWTYIGNDSYFS